MTTTWVSQLTLLSTTAAFYINHKENHMDKHTADMVLMVLIAHYIQSWVFMNCESQESWFNVSVLFDNLKNSSIKPWYRFGVNTSLIVIYFTH